MTCKTMVFLLDATNMNFLCACVGVHLRGHPKTPEGGLSRWRSTESRAGDVTTPLGRGGPGRGHQGGHDDKPRVRAPLAPLHSQQRAPGCGSSLLGVNKYASSTQTPRAEQTFFSCLRRTVKRGRGVTL